MTAFEPMDPDDLLDLIFRDAKRAHARGRGLSRRLYQTWQAGEIAGDDLRQALAVVWFEALYPLSWLALDQWRQLYDAAGFIVDGRAAPPCDRPVTLYRGVGMSRTTRRLAAKHTRGEIRSPEYGWSWTSSPADARFFADGLAQAAHDATPCVYQVTAQPSAILARYRTNSEYVVDTRQLDTPPEQIELPATTLRIPARIPR
ncbi:hypothetical protein [Nonomuraea wenchangensis]|uniref:hypothetical protein n=1 Tax=Nonomuraea wenchangensis TaxID=568860 RepID=UPI00340D574E